MKGRVIFFDSLISEAGSFIALWIFLSLCPWADVFHHLRPRSFLPRSDHDLLVRKTQAQILHEIWESIFHSIRLQEQYQN